MTNAWSSFRWNCPSALTCTANPPPGPELTGGVNVFIGMSEKRLTILVMSFVYLINKAAARSAGSSSAEDDLAGPPTLLTLY